MPRRLLIALLFAALPGCGAEMSAQSCLGTNWYAKGVDDGTRGEPNAALEEYTRECSEHKINPDRNAWFWGHAKGLSTFCADGPGFDVGSHGVDYQNACLGRPGETAFLLGYWRGLTERLKNTSADLVTLRRRFEGIVPHVEAQELMQRQLLLQADYNRAQSSMNWTDARLRTLTGEGR